MATTAAAVEAPGHDTPLQHTAAPPDCGRELTAVFWDWDGLSEGVKTAVADGDFGREAAAGRDGALPAVRFVVRDWPVQKWARAGAGAAAPV